LANIVAFGAWGGNNRGNVAVGRFHHHEVNMLAIIAALALSASPQQEFCDGYKAGWQAGWCSGQISTCPAQPVPPCPPMKVVQGQKPNDTGRDVGFVDGMAARRKLPGNGRTSGS
jgi:hypothetical protein